MDYKNHMKHALEHAEDALRQGEFPVGCVIAYQGEIIATGAREKTKGRFVNEVDHAELIALRSLAEKNLNIPMENATVFCTLEPCLMCYAAIILSGIRKIVYAYEDAMGGGTLCELSTLPPLYRNNSMTIIPGVMRSESLELFKSFFSNPNNKYWKGSYLEKYTLDADNL